MTQDEKFWSRVAVTDSCWVWTMSTNQGYGLTYTHKHLGRVASRVAWQLAVGVIPDGLFVCHHCDNRLCVRPDHLFLGTPKDNTSDMIAKGRQLWPGNKGVNNSRKTHCPYGHPFSEENTYRYKSRRSCRVCDGRRKRAYKLKLRSICVDMDRSDQRSKWTGEHDE
jgi:hypothetical protein